MIYRWQSSSKADKTHAQTHPGIQYPTKIDMPLKKDIETILYMKYRLDELSLDPDDLVGGT